MEERTKPIRDGWGKDTPTTRYLVMGPDNKYYTSEEYKRLRDSGAWVGDCLWVEERKETTMETIEPGDVVVLADDLDKEDRVEMTVEEVKHYTPTMVSCVWFHGNDVNRLAFGRDTLRVIKKVEVPE